MAIARVKSWTAGEVLTANDLNNEFNNLTGSVLVEPFVATQPVDLNGQVLILDADGDTLIDPSTNNTIDITINGVDDFRFTPNIFRALAGSNIVADQGDITASDGNVVVSNGRLLEAAPSDVFSATSITVPTTGHTFNITGTTTITSFSATQVGVMLYVRFTGSGLNLTHNAVSFIAPWGVDYRTVPNEVICFLSLGSGTYTFWSMNGPKERIGQSVQFDSATAPAGFLARDGSAVSRSTYSGLFSEIGTTHGVGDGITTFNVPDGRGRIDLQIDGAANRITSASTNGANADTLGGVGGSETITAADLPRMTVRTAAAAGGGGTAVALVTNANGFLDTQVLANVTGQATTCTNTQPWIAVNKYIRF